MRRSLLCALVVVAALPTRAADLADRSVSPEAGLRLTPPSLISDLVDAELVDEDRADDEPVRLAQAGNGQGKGQGGGSRVRVGAAMVGSSGVSPMGKPFGIGLELGSPTSLTLKYMLTPDQGVVGGFGAFGGPFLAPNISIYGDYLWHPHVLVRAPPFKLSWYIGGGIWTVWGQGLNPVVRGIVWYLYPSYFWLGVRMPLGIQLAFNQLPLELYLQAIPAISIFPQIAPGLGGSLGVRFYF